MDVKLGKMTADQKRFAITACLLFIVLAFLPAVQSDNISDTVKIKSTNNTIYVDDDGGGDYTNIQDAIDNASDGDTVFVYTGTYFENLLINKSITLEGENKENTILQGGGLTHAIKVKSNNVVITDLSITNKNKFSGISINYDNTLHTRYENISIINSNIYSTNNGITIENGTSYITISNCNIYSNNDNGIRISPDWDIGFDALPSSHHKYNIISNCNIYSNNNGIFMRCSSFNTITDCSISSNNYTGIEINWGKNNKIKNCNISSNKIGIKLRLANLNQISHCDISSNEIGILINNSFLNKFSINSYSNNEDDIKRELDFDSIAYYYLFQILITIPLETAGWLFEKVYNLLYPFLLIIDKIFN